MTNLNQNNISVIGLGYVGCVTSACLAYLRNYVIGVDVNDEKINLINKAKSPISEPSLNDFLKFGIKHKYLKATKDLEKAVLDTDISFICVPTPPKDDGSCNLDYLKGLLKDLGMVLAKKSQKHLIIVRSTIPPGTMENIIIPMLEEHSGKRNSIDFYTCFHPEFLREGTAINDYFNPPKYIIGENKCTHGGDRIIDLMVLNKNKQNVVRTSYKTAELVKYTDNVWHALKVTFANEIGALANCYEINSHELMEIFCKDKKLNISDYYLKPGLSYGGSCLPKDLESLQYLVNQHQLDLPIISSISTSNNTNIDKTISFIENHAHGNLGWYGISFKDNTDDLRNSVHLEIISQIKSKYNISIFDSNLEFTNLIQGQKEILLQKINDYEKIYVDDFIKLIDNIDTLVIGHQSFSDHINALLQYPRQLTILDLANININNNDTHHNYFGLYW